MSGRRARMLAFAGGIAGAGVSLLATTQPWFTARGDGFAPLAVGADVAAPSVTALAVAGFALVGAVAIANVLVRRILSPIQLLLGVGVGVVTARALGDPVAAVLPAVSASTGVAGSRSVVELVTGIDVSLWPGLALVGAAVLIATAVWTFATAPSWPASGSKYGGVDSTPTRASDWDALSDGADPTG